MVLVEEIRRLVETSRDHREYPLRKSIQGFFNELKEQVNAGSQKYAREISDDPNVQSCGVLLQRSLYQALEQVVEKAVQHRLQQEKDPSRWGSAAFIDQTYRSVFCALNQYYRDIFVDNTSRSQLNAIFGQHEAFQNFFVESLEPVLNNLSFHLLQGMICGKVAFLIQEKVVFHKGENGDTMLHFVCRHNCGRAFKAIVEHGLERRISNEWLVEFRAIARKADFLELETLIANLEAEPFKKKNLNGLLGRMGVIASPAAKVGILSSASPGYQARLPEEVSALLRPVSSSQEEEGIGITPGKSRLYVVWEILLDRDSDSRKVISLLLDEKKAYDPVEEPKRVKKAIPFGFPENTKSSILARIDRETLETWTPREKRYRDQAQSMYGFSSTDVARLAGFSARGGWHWCHLIAYTMGGPDGEKPIWDEERNFKGPQREFNLVLGTKEANGQMLIVEDTLKRLIQEQGFESLIVKVVPKFVKGLEAFHVAKSVEYTIQDREINPTRQITFEFDMLSRRRISPEEVISVVAIFNELFLNGEKAPRRILMTPRHNRNPLRSENYDEVGSPGSPYLGKRAIPKEEEIDPVPLDFSDEKLPNLQGSCSSSIDISQADTVSVEEDVENGQPRKRLCRPFAIKA